MGRNQIVGFLFVLMMTAHVWADDQEQSTKTVSQAVVVSRVLPKGQLPDDARLGTQRTLRDEYHPWTPAASKESWEKQAEQIRKRILVSNGLWPMPPRPIPEPIIYGLIERDDYTVEKVMLPTVPGFYLTGNLYRPKNLKGKAPAVLSPHGHWSNGRFYDAGAEGAQKQIDSGAEEFEAAAHHPVQARMVGLTRMGCVTFLYDMVGYADNKQIKHADGFRDAQAILRSQNAMGLQTYNSLCALDFLASLPDVDANRLGVSGSSGGGTQTFMLCAIDPRPAVAFPAVMVSTGMQGGCVCENAPYLRLGINNVAIAALFAPRPLGMTGADDWTIEIETKGLPELKQIYSYYDKAHLVDAKAYPQFGHNYNRPARERMYAWMNEHLRIGHETPYTETDFDPIPAEELSVFDGSHELPPDATDVTGVRAAMTLYQSQRFAELLPRAKSDLEEYRDVVATAAEVMLDKGVPGREQLERQDHETANGDGFEIYKLTVGRKGAKEQVPVIALISQNYAGEGVLWIHPAGKAGLFKDDGKPTAAVQKLLDAGYGVVGADLFMTGEFIEAGKEPVYPELDENYAGYTLNFNRSLLANRVRDILTVIGAMQADDNVATVHILGSGEAGPWALLARALAGASVEKTIVDANGFGFSKINEVTDPMLLPGALAFGGIGGLSALAAPHKLTIAGVKNVPISELNPLKIVYKAAGGQLSLLDAPLNADQMAGLFTK